MQPEGAEQIVKVGGGRECNPLSSRGDRDAGMEMSKSPLSHLAHFEEN